MSPEITEKIYINIARLMERFHDYEDRYLELYNADDSLFQEYYSRLIAANNLALYLEKPADQWNTSSVATLVAGCIGLEHGGVLTDANEVAEFLWQWLVEDMTDWAHEVEADINAKELDAVW